MNFQTKLNHGPVSVLDCHTMRGGRGFELVVVALSRGRRGRARGDMRAAAVVSRGAALKLATEAAELLEQQPSPVAEQSREHACLLRGDAERKRAILRRR